MVSIYKHDYVGTADLSALDGYSPLRRWFENYKLDRGTTFADEHEWLTIEEKKFCGLRRSCVRYVGHIGAVESDGPRRTVLFETGAPAPPTFYRPAKFRPERRQRRVHDADTFTIQTMWEVMDRIGLSRDRQAHMAREARSFYELQDMGRLEMLRYEENRLRLATMNWVMPILATDQLISGYDLMPVEKPKLPPPKQYRRN